MIFERSITDSIFIVNSIPEHAFLGTAGFAGQSAPLYIYDQKSNTSILSNRQQKTNEGFHHVFASNEIAESSVVSNRTGEINSQFPLYITEAVDGKRANFSETKIKELFSDVEQPDGNSKKVYPEDLIDYIYASLHSPSYRQKYKEFLKTDFPRVPRPANWSEFWRLTELGRELRELHLMKSSAIDQYGTTFSEGGDNEIEKVEYKDEKVWINSTQYFGNIPETTWSFWIGGYQPAQKWLKDRKGRKLSDADLDHYQKIIKVLTETARIMQQIG